MKIYGVSKSGRIYREEQEAVEQPKQSKPSEPIIPIGMKVCSRCKEVLPILSFHSDSGSSDGRRSACRECVSKAGKEKRARKC